jgi:predicted DNA-binding protein (UPF0251 family)
VIDSLIKITLRQKDQEKLQQTKTHATMPIKRDTKEALKSKRLKIALEYIFFSNFFQI